MRSAALAALFAGAVPAWAAAGWTVDPVMGVNTHYLYEQPGETRQLANAGLRVVRTDAAWWTIEPGPQRGVYNFTGYDTLVDTLTQNNIRPYFTINLANYMYDHGQSPKTPDGRAGFVNFTMATVSRYAGRGIIWEMYNEPNLPVNKSSCNWTSAASTGAGAGIASADIATAGREMTSRPLAPAVAMSALEALPSGAASRTVGATGVGGWFPCNNTADYVALALAVGAAIKGAHPGETFIGPAVSQAYASDKLDVAFLTACFEAGLLQYWDAVSAHFYRPGAPETNEGEVAQLRALIDAYAPAGKAVPILSGEWGYTTADAPHTGGPGANETVAAQYLARMFLSNLFVGINLSIWYDWHNDGTNATYSEHNFGLVHYAYNNASLPYLPKPGYTAAAAMSAGLSLGSCAYTGRLSGNVTGDVTCYASYFDCGFLTPGFAAWCNAPYGWVGNWTFPYDWPAAGRVAAGREEGGAEGAAVPGRVSSAGACYMRYDYLGAQQGYVCSGGDPLSWTLPLSAGVTYLRSS